MTLNKFEFSENLAGFRRFERQRLLNEWRQTRIVSDSVKPSERTFQRYVPCVDLP